VKAQLIQRAVGAVALVLVGWFAGSMIADSPNQARDTILGICVGAVLGFSLAPVIVTRPYNALRHVVSYLPLLDLVFATFGLILGLIVAALLSYPLSFLPWWFGHLLPAAAAVICAYLGVSLVMMRRPELGRFVQTHFGREPADTAETAPPQMRILVDTSAIIDGRIADIVRTGFLGGELVVPEFVLKELQQVADSADPLKRARGRRGLQVVQDLRSDVTVATPDVDFPQVPDVDAKLLKLAKERGMAILTTDFNLNRLAQIQDVPVLNVNDLANALKPAVLPGERLDVLLIKEGKEQNQGVGYLDDGTMVVVEKARERIGQKLGVQVTSVLQQPSGKIIFTKIAGDGD
jgi:uncharacterized protein YacL